MKNWVNGIPYEIAFWNRIFSSKKSIGSLFQWSKFNKEIELTNFNVKEFLFERANQTVIDVGCGMSFCNGDKLGGENLRICYIDPLAPFYNKIIESKKLELPKIMFGFIEYLSAFIDQKASLIIVQNALDHSKNPQKGILECIESLEIGGVLYLRHHKNEAETENYRGFHQHNISIENEDLIIWNNDEKINVNTFLEGIARVETSSFENEVIAVITKDRDLIEGAINRRNDIALLSNDYIEIVEKFNKISYSLMFHWSFIRFTLVQKLVSVFSWRNRQRIKKIISKISTKSPSK